MYLLRQMQSVKTHGIVKVCIWEVVPHKTENERHVGLLGIEDGIRPGVVRVGSELALTCFFAGAIELFDELHNGSTGVIHVKDGRTSVHGAGMKVVAISHCEVCKAIKVVGGNCLAHLGHALRHDVFYAML